MLYYSYKKKIQNSNINRSFNHRGVTLMNMHTPLRVSFFLFVVIYALSAATFSGRVVDKETGDGIEGLRFLCRMLQL